MKELTREGIIKEIRGNRKEKRKGMFHTVFTILKKDGKKWRFIFNRKHANTNIKY